MDGEIRKGRIKVFKDRGFGFIKDDQGGPDLFFHINNLKEVKLRYYATYGLLPGKTVYFIEKNDEPRRIVEEAWLAEN
ncbi:MAG: cold shock domain-containing protein [Syntrophales bacterium]